MRHLLSALILLASALPALALPYSGIYIFGDSLSDVGNVQNVYSTLPHPPGAPSTVPGAPYDSAGRASNGPIYIDTLARGLGFTATPSSTGGNDYAYGGARTRYQVFGPPFMGILDQISAFRSAPGAADAGALYVVWGGANNLQDIIMGRSLDVLGQPIPGAYETISDLVSGILRLYAEGARSFFVPNVPDLALTPRVGEYGAAAQAGARQLSLLFNARLSAALQQLEASHADLDIITFDTYTALNRIVANPTRYGIANTTNRCYTGNDMTFTGGGTVCANPDSYLFWDGIHPTSQVHAILGQEMLGALGIPEPASLLLVTAALLAADMTRRTIQAHRMAV
jgi:phospholipase/lecithinase/hemolysin